MHNNINSNTDEQMMLLIQKGNKEALSAIYNRYSKKITYFFYRMLNQDFDKAQDFMHDLFLKIINNPDAFDTDKKFSTWIYTIANNMCKNEYKKISIRNEHKNNEINSSNNKQYYIEDIIDNKLFKSRLNSVLERLDEGHKAIFILRFQQDLQIKEIAEITNIPEGTVKSRLFSTLKIMSDNLKEFNPMTQ